MNGERGAAGVAVVLAALLASGAGLAIVTLATDLGASAVRARTGAEAAALAAVSTSTLAGGSGDPEPAAAQAAAANGAVLVRCCGEQLLEAEAHTAVEPATRLLRTFRARVHARATAGLRPPPEAGPLTGGAGLLQRPVAGVLTSGFGWRTHPITGERRFHAGVDIAAPVGTPVRAAAAGTVASAGWRGGYGLTVVVDHGGGLSTLYAHLSRADVPAGAQVQAGAVIGAVGSTGLSTGPHLHFEVRVHGRPQDPLGAAMVGIVQPLLQ